jgi:hypothetical protein
LGVMNVAPTVEPHRQAEYTNFTVTAFLLPVALD